MTPEQLRSFAEKLKTEKELLEKELQTVGRRNPDNPADWEAVPADTEEDGADENVIADTIEEYEGNTAILKQLEIRYNEVLGAIERIENGSYGKCEVSGEPIEMDRLEANPAAKTCKAHMR